MIPLIEEFKTECDEKWLYYIIFCILDFAFGHSPHVDFLVPCLLCVTIIKNKFKNNLNEGTFKVYLCDI